MKYMLMAYDSDYHESPPEEQQRRVRQHWKALAQLVGARGPKKLVLASVGLNSLADSIVIRNHNGSFPTVAGPFTETREVLGGFDIIDFDSRDEALEFALREHTHEGHIAEVRPIVDMWWINSVGTARADKQYFMISYFGDEELAMKHPPSRMAESIAQHEGIANEYLAEHFRKGKSAFWAGARLERTRTATTFRIGPGGSYAKSDGPFAETKEVIGGFAMLSCTRDEAIEWTRKLLPLDGDIASITAVNSFSWFYHGGLSGGR
jgi:hypothetical protein